MAARRALTWLRGTAVYRYRLTIWVVVFTAITVIAGLESVIAIDRIERLAARERAEDEIEDAQACVLAWERTYGSRSAIALSVEGVLNLAFAVGVDPAEEPAIREAAVPIIQDAQAEIPDPVCNRARALERLEEGAP